MGEGGSKPQPAPRSPPPPNSRDMDRQEARRESWKKFSVILVGKTDGAHKDIVKKLRAIGHTEVSSPGQSDYLLVFCPVVSRVGTDICEALQKVPGGKPVILVVMHHTFKNDKIIADSRRQVDNQNVRLTVDCLYYEGRLLKCQQNQTAWSDVRESFRVSSSQLKGLN